MKKVSVKQFNLMLFLRRFGLICVGAIIVFAACIDKMALPSGLGSDIGFSAGDTTYLRVNPVWGEEYGFQSPVGISIGQDGYVFIADSAGHSIFVLEQDGDIPDGFSSLRELTYNETYIAPIDVDIDNKMNVLFIDGSQQIFCWNQLWNHVGIQAIALSGVFFNEAYGDSSVEQNTETWRQFANGSSWSLTETVWDSSGLQIDSLLALHLIYDGALARYNYSDVYYASEESEFSGLSVIEGPADGFYVTDKYHNRILRIRWLRTDRIRLNTGEEIWVHDGVFDHIVEDYGTGAGTVNQPTGIDVDYAGQIYYTQSGEFFGVHKLKPDNGQYPSVFQPGVNYIMDLDRYNHPQDVAVDANQMIYVANTDAQEIQVFDSGGQFFRKVGVQDIIVDTTMTVISGTDTTTVDTFYTREVKGLLEEPRAVTVDNRGIVYVVDTPMRRIVRYRLSNQLDENLNPVE